MIKLTSTDLAILNCLHDDWAPLRFFVNKERDMLFNRGAPDLGPKDLAARFQTLIASGLLVGRAAAKGTFVPSPDEIETVLVHPAKNSTRQLELFVGLTALGGEHWETVFAPDWSLYFDRLDASSDKERIEAASEDLLHSIIEIFRAHRNFVASTLQVKSLHPWSPIYWKYLAEGCRARFRTRKESPAVEEAIAELRERWASKIRRRASEVLK